MRLTSNHLFWVISLVLFCLSIFFTYSITSFKKELNLSGKSLLIQSGQEALVAKIIDGDEVSVLIDDQQVVVRILGIGSAYRQSARLGGCRGRSAAVDCL